MNIERTYWNRSGYLKIQMPGSDELQQFGGDGEMFDMKFDGLKYGDFYEGFTCSILGLSRNTINDLTVWDVGKALKDKRYIEVYAGYTSSGNDMTAPIFKGYVMNAIPTSPPEMWMNFECIRAWDKDDYVIGVEMMENASLKQILKKVAEILNVSYDDSKSWAVNSVDGDEAKYRFNFSALKRYQLPNAFAKQFNCRVVNNNGMIIAAEKRGWLIQPTVNDIVGDPISQDNGLLGIGNIDIAGAKIVHRLNDNFPILSWVKLDSRLIESANAKPYFVTSVRHTGHLRGVKWQTEIELIRHGAAV